MYIVPTLENGIFSIRGLENTMFYYLYHERRAVQIIPLSRFIPVIIPEAYSLGWVQGVVLLLNINKAALDYVTCVGKIQDLTIDILSFWVLHRSSQVTQ